MREMNAWIRQTIDCSLIGLTNIEIPLLAPRQPINMPAMQQIEQLTVYEFSSQINLRNQ